MQGKGSKGKWVRGISIVGGRVPERGQLNAACQRGRWCAVRLWAVEACECVVVPTVPPRYTDVLVHGVYASTALLPVVADSWPGLPRISSAYPHSPPGAQPHRPRVAHGGGRRSLRHLHRHHRRPGVQVRGGQGGGAGGARDSG